MTPNPKFIHSSEELAQCLFMFTQNDIHFVPVVSPSGEVLGLLSEFAMIKASLRRYLDPDKHEKIYAHKDLLEEASICFPADSVEEVIKAMIKSPTHRVLVIDHQKRLTGIISPKDILHLLSGQQKKANDLRKDLENARHEADKLNREVTNLKENLERYKMLFENAPQMIHGVDQKGTIVFANKKIHETLGYKPNELIGINFNILYPSTIHHETANALQNLISGGDQFTTYSTMIKKDGSKIRVDIASSALLSPDGKKFLHTISISREVDSEALLRALHGAI